MTGHWLGVSYVPARRAQGGCPAACQPLSHDSGVSPPQPHAPAHAATCWPLPTQLYHTYQGGCAKKYDKGDMVEDTPAERRANKKGCDTVRNTCKGTKLGLAGNDDVKNFMARRAGQAERVGGALACNSCAERPSLAIARDAVPQHPIALRGSLTSGWPLHPCTQDEGADSCVDHFTPGARQQPGLLRQRVGGRALLAVSGAQPFLPTRNPMPPRRPGRAHDAAMARVPRRDLGWCPFPVGPGGGGQQARSARPDR
jgi:hypothetical protein